MEDWQERSLAAHECGHALIALIHDVPFATVDIIPDHENAGRTTFGVHSAKVSVLLQIDCAGWAGVTIAVLKNLDGDGFASLAGLSEYGFHLFGLTEAMKGLSERTAWLLRVRTAWAAELEHNVLHWILLQAAHAIGCWSASC